MNELQPKVSICIAQYNRSEELPACLDSLLKQDYPNFEIVVVNDGSPDPKVSEILADYSDRYENIITLNQDNTGFVGAINKAISLAQGEFIAIQGAGDISYSKRIAKQVSFLNGNPEVGLVATRYINKYVGGEMDGLVHKESKEHGYASHEILSKYNIINHGTAMFRKVIFEKVGGYREYFRVGQDMDLWLRMLDFCSMYVMDEVLYERGLFVKDGIAVDKKKTILQKYLVSFAIQCWREREKYGKDPVQIYGNHAGLFKKPCGKLSRYLARESLEYLRFNNFTDAEKMLYLSMSEKKTVYVLITNALVKLSKIVFLRPIISNILDSLLPKNTVK